MMQQTLIAFEQCRTTTRRRQFLADMDRIASWEELQAVVEPFYPKVGRGRRAAADSAPAGVADPFSCSCGS